MKGWKVYYIRDVLRQVRLVVQIKAFVFWSFKLRKRNHKGRILDVFGRQLIGKVSDFGAIGQGKNRVSKF